MRCQALLLILCHSTVLGFAPKQISSRSETSLNAFNQVNGIIEKATASLALGSVIFSNIAVLPAVALDQQDFGTSQVIAARSGGRSGGRSSSYKAPPAVRAGKAAPAPVVIRETRYVTTPSYGAGQAVMMAPQPVMMAPQPGIPGLGVIAGLGAINAIGDGMREMRQENEIRDARAQVQEARIKEAELEARLRSLERSQYPNAVSP
jgi:hypothetical protein